MYLNSFSTLVLSSSPVSSYSFLIFTSSSFPRSSNSVLTAHTVPAFFHKQRRLYKSFVHKLINHSFPKHQQRQQFPYFCHLFFSSLSQLQFDLNKCIHMNQSHLNCNVILLTNVNESPISYLPQFRPKLAKKISREKKFIQN